MEATYGDDVEYIPMLSTDPSSTHRHHSRFTKSRGLLIYAAVLLAGLILGSIIGRWNREQVPHPNVVETSVTFPDCPSQPHPPPLTILDSFQDINNISPAVTSPFTVNPEEKAIVTSLYSDGYASAVATLGHSLSKINTTSRKIVMYLSDRVSSYSLCLIQAEGWELHPVVHVPPPHDGDGVYSGFVDQYTKLRIWTLDKIGVKSAIYLDADTLVKQNFDELFDLPFQFAAVPDVYLDARGFTIAFNAGVLALKPDTKIFEDMMAKVEEAEYNREAAEQSYLNLYFGQQVVRIPHVYNGNMAIKIRSRSYWDAIQEQMRIVHFTLGKPFNGHPWCGERACSVEEIFDPTRMREYIEEAKKEWDGVFIQEIEWWASVYEEMLLYTESVCDLY